MMDLKMEDQVTPEKCSECNRFFIDDHFCFGVAYKVAGHDGIAWYAYAYDTEMIEDQIYDEAGEWIDVEYFEAENQDRVKCHMVGDDSEWIFDITDLTPLDEEEYCPSCGQIGCGWGH